MTFSRSGTHEADDEHLGFGVGGNDGEYRSGCQHRWCAAWGAASHGRELSWGPSTDEEPHDQAEIVAGDVHEVALAQVVAAAQPGAAHAAAIEGEGEAALDQFGPELERFLGDA